MDRVLVKQRVKQALRRAVGEPHVGKRLKLRAVSPVLRRLELDPRSILDAGAEDATFVYWLADRYPESQVLAVDIDAAAIAACLAARPARYARRVEFRVGSFADLEPRSLDLVTAFDVLEHITADALAVAHLARALRPGGHLLVHVPRDQWTTRAGTVHRFADEDAWQINAGHVRMGYSPERMRELLTGAGLNVLDVQVWLGRWGTLAFDAYTRAGASGPPAAAVDSNHGRMLGAGAPGRDRRRRQLRLRARREARLVTGRCYSAVIANRWHHQPVPSSQSTRRLPALDGLRGLAALVVVFHHCLLVSPRLSHAYLVVHRGPIDFSWWLTYSPLHLFWMGGEAVLVFFVLSGFVLAFPAASGRFGGWKRYYPQRLLRLYLPVAAAVAFAFAVVPIVRRGPDPRTSDWLGGHFSHFTLHDAAHDAFLLRGGDSLDGPLWSLQWEMLFSLALPLYFLVLLRDRHLSATKAGVLLLIICISSRGPAAAPLGVPFRAAMLYMPIFGLGVLMAQRWSAIQAWGHRFEASKVVRVACVVGFGILMFGYWAVSAFHGVTDTWLSVARAAQVVAACMLVAYFAATRGGAAIGTARPVAWLGKRSFSLYLIHEPIVVTTAFALNGTHNPALVLVIALPVSLLAADVFYRLVEGPSHRLSQRVGRAIAQRRSRRLGMATPAAEQMAARRSASPGLDEAP